MNERVNRLRRATLETTPRLSIERAALLTEFCRKDKTASVPIRRARAFQYIMENKEIYIGKDELIVGERGPTPKAAPTFPELCCHSLGDFEILNSREKISIPWTTARGRSRGTKRFPTGKAARCAI